MGAVLPHLSGVLLCHHLQVVPGKHELLGRQTMFLQQEGHQIPLQQGKHSVSRVAMQLHCSCTPHETLQKGAQDIQRPKEWARMPGRAIKCWQDSPSFARCSREARTAQALC